MRHRFSASVIATALLAVTGCERPPDGAGEPDRETASRPPATNHLAGEKSPYLLHHAHHPVDWHPWGDAAFELARQEDKPVLVSVGFSSCHWCHVMDRETFSNEAIAAYLNDHFVCIKVDREERPDVDRIYMAYVEDLTGSGGWPMNVFVTPDRKPFYGGNYFPPQDQDGKKGFRGVITRIHDLWATRRDAVLATADTTLALIESKLATPPPGDAAAPMPDIPRLAAARLKLGYDPENGGFSGAPKFPSPAIQRFLLHQAMRDGDEELVEMVEFTCDRMAAGGIHDQLGGGFARYAVDAQWRIPHFEKMLYDNAQLLELYLDLYRVTGAPRHASVARGIANYVLRDLTGPHGGFYSAEDADSEGREGAFYLWTRKELASLLSAEEYAVTLRHYGITPEGNFIEQSHPDPTGGRNVLGITEPDLTGPERRNLESAKQKMFAAREKRMRPHLDDKVLASWNGLMLGALARAAVILRETRYREAAERNFAFLMANLWDAPSRTLFHRWRDGSRDDVQLLEGYAAMLDGTLALYQTGRNPEHLEFAIVLADAMLDRFHDDTHGGFWQTAGDTEGLLLRLKDHQDGGLPSGNAQATLALLRLADITGEVRFREAADGTLRLFADRMLRTPQVTGSMLRALIFSQTQPPPAR